MLYIAVDGTPAYLWDYKGWETITGNHGLQEPRYILAHALYTLVPNAKIIAILRDPTSRYSHSYCDVIAILRDPTSRYSHSYCDVIAILRDPTSRCTQT